MRKKTSLRRWKARADLGKVIPREAIEEHDLSRWFLFDQADLYVETYVATARRWRHLYIRPIKRPASQ